MSILASLIIHFWMNPHLHQTLAPLPSPNSPSISRHMSILTKICPIWTWSSSRRRWMGAARSRIVAAILFTWFCFRLPWLRCSSTQSKSTWVRRQSRNRREKGGSMLEIGFNKSSWKTLRATWRSDGCATATEICIRMRGRRSRRKRINNPLKIAAKNAWKRRKSQKRWRMRRRKARIRLSWRIGVTEVEWSNWDAIIFKA